jgi:hypothetical protein
MFLVKDRRFGMDNYVFTRTDPRSEGFKGEVIEGTTLEFDMNAIFLWPDGEPQPNPQLGRDPKNPRHYKVFKSPDDLHASGFEFVHSYAPVVPNSWSNYRKHYYPSEQDFAKMTQDEWFDYLEEADTGARIRKKLYEPAEPTPGSTREQIAEWVAKRHMAADGGILQVLFLQSGSPADEIRLLEVSERYTGEAAKIEPVDFGLDVVGANFKLVVADITVQQLGKIRADPAKMLPSGWKLNDAIVWGRRGRLQ